MELYPVTRCRQVAGVLSFLAGRWAGPDGVQIRTGGGAGPLLRLVQKALNSLIGNHVIECYSPKTEHRGQFRVDCGCCITIKKPLIAGVSLLRSCSSCTGQSNCFLYCSPRPQSVQCSWQAFNSQPPWSCRVKQVFSLLRR